MQIGCSLPCLQNPPISPHPQSDNSTPHILSLFFKITFNIVSHSRLSLVGLFSGSATSPVRFSLLSHTRYMLCLSQPSRIDQRNNSRFGVKAINFKKCIFLEGGGDTRRFNVVIAKTRQQTRHPVTSTHNQTSQLMPYCPFQR
jgi:hypothetical protein